MLLQDGDDIVEALYDGAVHVERQVGHLPFGCSVQQEFQPGGIKNVLPDRSKVL